MAARRPHRHRRLAPLWVRAVILLVAAGGGGALVWPLLGPVAALLAGWAILAVGDVLWTWLLIWPMDAAQTRSHAGREDPGRAFARVVALVGSCASLGAVALVVAQASAARGLASIALLVIAVVAVAGSWGLIQTDYVLRYARTYYTDPIGGISFNQDEDPMYSDFAYFALGIGMTYQVADTDVRTNAIRRMVVAQSLLGYLFGVVIIATIVNLLAGLA